MKHAVTIICVLTMLLQGGFSDAAWCICGIIAAGFLCLRWKRTVPAAALILMAAAVVIFAVPALFHGVSYEALASIMKLITACMLVLSFFAADTDARETVFVTGMAAAAVGYLTFCGVFHWDGAVASRRLQSVFQYANAAGIFLGVAAFLIRNDEKRAPFAIFPETAMLLTQSVGAILVYIAGWAIYLLKNGKKSEFPQAFLGFAVSLLSAAAIYAIVYMTGAAQLALVFPVAMIVFRKSIRKAIIKVSGFRILIRAGCFAGFAAVAALFAARGLRPVATYLERLIQIADGLKATMRNPFGIGPGAWQFMYQAYQSAPYNATILHCGYVAAIVGAGLAIVFPITLAIVYWLRRQKWDARSICVIMILLHAVMDITFSFLSIVFVLATLLAETFREGVSGMAPREAHPPQRNANRQPPREQQKKHPLELLRVLFAVPLALCAVLLVTSAIKNLAAWAASSGDPASAAELLGQRIIKNDTEALMTEMDLYLQTGDHDSLDATFRSVSRPNAEAYGIKARSQLQRRQYNEAADSAYLCAELSPHSDAGFLLLDETLPYLDEAAKMIYSTKAAALKSGTRQNALYLFIIRIGDG